MLSIFDCWGSAVLVLRDPSCPALRDPWGVLAMITANIIAKLDCKIEVRAIRLAEKLATVNLTSPLTGFVGGKRD